MTSKADFTDEEWARLKRAPFVAGMAISLADPGGPIEAFKESSADNVGILAGGIAYAAFLAIFPAMIAGISLYALVADPATIAQQAEGVLAALPQDAETLIRAQITSLTPEP